MGKEFIIHTPKEFSFTINYDYLTSTSNECLYRVVEHKIIRALLIEGEKVLIEIQGKTETKLVIRLLGNNIPTNVRMKQGVIQYIHDWFDLGIDLQPFYEMAKEDPLLKKPYKKFWGLRNIGFPDLFEAIAWGILGQQINLNYAYTLKRRLVEKYGEYILYEGQKYWLFPTADMIAQLTIDDLADLKMTVRKCEYLIDVAKLIAQGKLTREKLLATNNVKEAEKILTKIRGIGPWTANYVLMRCLRFPSAFPIDDVGLHLSLKAVMEKEEKPTKEEIIHLSRDWKGWESYAVFYLWRMLY